MSNTEECGGESFGGRLLVCLKHKNVGCVRKESENLVLTNSAFSLTQIYFTLTLLQFSFLWFH